MARFALLTAALLLLLPACGSAERQTAASPDARRDADVHALKAAIDAGPIRLFDVRSRSEYFAGHVAEADLMPIAELQAGRRDELGSNMDEEIWLICQSGGRSGKAADLLAGEGFRVVNVTGGTAAWIEAGFPVE